MSKSMYECDIVDTRKKPDRPVLSIIIPYYNHPHFLRIQADVWGLYDNWVAQRTEIIIVDDGSERPINQVPGIRFPANARLFRIPEDILWNEKGARNLGAHVASGEWLLHMDFDHWLSNASVRALVAMDKDPDKYYRFRRIDTGKVVKTHSETHMVRRDKFFEAGAYDESYSGMYSAEPYQKYVTGLTKIGCRLQHLDNIRLYRESGGIYGDAACPGDRATLLKQETMLTPEQQAKREGMTGMLRFEWKELCIEDI